MTSPRPPTDAELEQLVADSGVPVYLTTGRATSLVGWLYDPEDLPDLLRAVAHVIDHSRPEDR